MRTRPPATAIVLLLLTASHALAQDATVEARLRDALRRTTVDLRALQDSQAGVQATLDQAKQQNEQLTRQLDELKTGAAARPAAPAAPDPQAAALLAAVAVLEEQNKSLRSDVGKLRSAYQQTADLARAKESEGQQATQRWRATQARFDLCQAANGKLTGVANDILHLYRTPAFRSTLLGSYEPLIGFKQVELQNTIQDYEDRIYEHRYFNVEPPARPAAAPAAASAQVKQ